VQSAEDLRKVEGGCDPARETAFVDDAAGGVKEDSREATPRGVILARAWRGQSGAWLDKEVPCRPLTQSWRYVACSDSVV